MKHRVPIEQARATAPVPGFLQVFRRGTLSVELYRPRGPDPQTPHEQDELYVVVTGSGTFFCNGETQAFGAGDVLFAAAGTEHRFQEFTDDLEVWVIFCGPPGGEQASERTLFGARVTE